MDRNPAGHAIGAVESGPVIAAIAISRIAIAGIPKAIASNSSVNRGAIRAAICPSVDARNAQRCPRSSYSGFSTVNG